MFHYRTTQEINELIFFSDDPEDIPTDPYTTPHTFKEVANLADIHLDIGSTLGIKKLLIDVNYSSSGAKHVNTTPPGGLGDIFGAGHQPFAPSYTTISPMTVDDQVTVAHTHEFAQGEFLILYLNFDDNVKSDPDKVMDYRVVLPPEIEATAHTDEEIKALRYLTTEQYTALKLLSKRRAQAIEGMNFPRLPDTPFTFGGTLDSNRIFIFLNTSWVAGKITNGDGIYAIGGTDPSDLRTISAGGRKLYGASGTTFRDDFYTLDTIPPGSPPGTKPVRHRWAAKGTDITESPTVNPDKWYRLHAFGSGTPHFRIVDKNVNNAIFVYFNGVPFARQGSAGWPFNTVEPYTLPAGTAKFGAWDFPVSGSGAGRRFGVAIPEAVTKVRLLAMNWPIPAQLTSWDWDAVTTSTPPVFPPNRPGIEGFVTGGPGLTTPTVPPWIIQPGSTWASDPQLDAYCFDSAYTLFGPLAIGFFDRNYLFDMDGNYYTVGNFHASDPHLLTREWTLNNGGVLLMGDKWPNPSSWDNTFAVKYDMGPITTPAYVRKTLTQ